jgi:hypothetical protein
MAQLGSIQSVRDQLKEYGDRLKGVGYRKWKPEMGFDSGPPFWIADIEPSLADVKKGGVNCLGLINLIRLHFELPTSQNPFVMLEKRGVLHEFDRDTQYPFGTLLVRPYRDDNDQGHYAIMWDDGNVLHAHTRLAKGESFVDVSTEHLTAPGVVVEPLEYSNSWFQPNTYTHVCMVGDWLGSN